MSKIFLKRTRETLVLTAIKPYDKAMVNKVYQYRWKNSLEKYVSVCVTKVEFPNQ